MTSFDASAIETEPEDRVVREVSRLSKALEQVFWVRRVVLVVVLGAGLASAMVAVTAVKNNVDQRAMITNRVAAAVPARVESAVAPRIDELEKHLDRRLDARLDQAMASWSARHGDGPAGIQGPQGETGPGGPAGPAGSPGISPEEVARLQEALASAQHELTVAQADLSRLRTDITALGEEAKQLRSEQKRIKGLEVGSVDLPIGRSKPTQLAWGVSAQARKDTESKGERIVVELFQNGQSIEKLLQNGQEVPVCSVKASGTTCLFTVTGNDYLFTVLRTDDRPWPLKNQVLVSLRRVPE